MKTVDTDKTPCLSKPERIQFLDSLRGLAIIMVVGVHSLGYCLPLQQDYKDYISFIVHTVSVPVFFLVDGFLFARSIRSSKTYKYEETVKKSGSSAESVGSLGCRQVAKPMIQGYF